MFRSFIAIMALSCCISAGVAQGKGSAELSAWYVDSLVKVFPNDAPLAHALRSPEFTGARNQHLSVLLAIRSSRPLPALTAEVKPLEGGAGRSIASVEVHHVAYVVVGSHPPDSPPDELVGTAPGWYPDPLEDFPFDLEARRTTPIWVTIAIPPDAAPGVYEGSIALRSGDRLLARRPFRLRVMKRLGACGDVSQGHQLVHLGRQDLATVLRRGGLFAAVVDAGFQCGARLGRASSKRDHNAASHAHPTSPRRRQSPIRLHQLRPMGRDVPAGGSNRVHRGQPLARPRRQL